MSSLRDILNRARWRDADLHALRVHVVHRGAPGGTRVISGGRITAATATGISLAPETDDGDAGFVPYHRFLAIVDADGRALWSKDGGEAARSDDAQTSGARADDAAEAREIAPSHGVVLREADERGPLVIDGSAGEGGGQILRTSLALSIATGTPFTIEEIRAGRGKPGLLRQHLTCIKAAALVSRAEVSGAELGSSRVSFRPREVVAGEHTVDVASAGSVSLVLQTVAFALASSGGAITVRGGTHALWAPPFPFLELAWLPLVRRAGAEVDLTLAAHGFHPAGGGEVKLSATASGELAPLHLTDRGALEPLELHAIVSGLSEGIARRELSAAAERLTDTPARLTSGTVRSAGPGNAIWLVARDDASGVCNVFSGIGDPGVPAEDVGRGVAEAFLAWRESGASVEGHLADQLMLPIALAGAGSFTTSELTLHATTNMEVIAAFTGRRLRAFELEGGRFRVSLDAT